MPKWWNQWGRNGFRLTHKATGTSLSLWYGGGLANRTMHAAHSSARRWLSSIVKHKQQPPEPENPIRSYTIDPDWAAGIRQGGKQLVIGRDEVLSALNGNLTPLMLAQRKAASK